MYQDGAAWLAEKGKRKEKETFVMQLRFSLSIGEACWILLSVLYYA
jgi:hypothetical protein